MNQSNLMLYKKVPQSFDFCTIDLFSLFSKSENTMYKPEALNPMVSWYSPWDHGVESYWNNDVKKETLHRYVPNPVTIQLNNPSNIYLIGGQTVVETASYDHSTHDVCSAYWVCDVTSHQQMPNLNTMSYDLNHKNRVKSESPQMLAKKEHLENLEEAKVVFASQNPNMTKDQMYDEMLKPYRCSKHVEVDTKTGKEKVSYRCDYDGCSKVFTKTWNLLDHVRMHEGIRPYKCAHCPKSFTQKGNLKKHQIQHTISTLKERKRFICHICNKGYTEKIQPRGKSY